MALPFRPYKRFGQHFLIDSNCAAKIVAALSAPAQSPVVEIGPGTGALTGLLLQRFADVTAVEIDKRAAAYLARLHPRLNLLCADVLELDWTALAKARGSGLFVIGNLPYNLTSPILFALLRARHVLRQAVVMMQREVAARVVAQPGSKTYGIPSVLTQLYASTSLLFKVSRNVFVPRPDVESAVVRLDFDRPDPEDVDTILLQSIVRAAFGQRRKMLRNSLHRWTQEQGILLPVHWASARAEDLAPSAFVALCRHIQAGAEGPTTHVRQ